MTQVVPVATPYQLPFRARVQRPPLFRGGTSVAVSVALERPISDWSLHVLNGFVDVFWVLANSGALGGDSVAPGSATIMDKTDPTVDSGVVRWQLEGCDLDERAGIHLVHLLLAAHETVPFHELQIADSHQSGTIDTLIQDPRIENPYPPQWRDSTFPMEIEPWLTDYVAVRMECREEFTPKQISDISTSLLGWAAAAAVGAYAVAPLSPMSTYLDPDREVEAEASELTWNLHKVRVHSAALDGLVNVCLAIDQTIAPLRGLWIG